MQELRAFFQWSIDRLKGPMGPALAAIGFLLIFLGSSWRFNEKLPLDHWAGDLRSDAAGYYIYLPGLFHHGMRASRVSDSLVDLGGISYHKDRERDRIITKFTYGVALMELPYFVAAELIEGPGRTDGWTRTHHRAIEAAGIVHWTLGLFLLGSALWRWSPTSAGAALLTLACIAFGTNTFYYAFRMPGYSHVHSFMLVCAGLYLVLSRTDRPMSMRRIALFSLVVAVLVLIRPSDAILACALWTILYILRPELRWKVRPVLMQLVIGSVVALPQMAYWKFAHDQWVHYSYNDEGFTNALRPMWSEVLAAPRNGLLPNAPIFALLPVGLVVIAARSWRLALTLAATFALGIWSCASWHVWHFGCSFGMRPLVQYTPLLGLALWVFFPGLRNRSSGSFGAVVACVGLLCFLNYRAMLQYSGCFEAGTWDWAAYVRNIEQAFLGHAVF